MLSLNPSIISFVNYVFVSSEKSIFFRIYELIQPMPAYCFIISSEIFNIFVFENSRFTVFDLTGICFDLRRFFFLKKLFFDQVGIRSTVTYPSSVCAVLTVRRRICQWVGNVTQRHQLGWVWGQVGGWGWLEVVALMWVQPLSMWLRAKLVNNVNALEQTFLW